MLMARKEIKITGKVTEVRILNMNDVLVFVKVGSPENIQNKIVRFHITAFNDASSCGCASYSDWAELAVGDLVHITRIHDSEENLNDYSLNVVQSDVLDANDL